MRKLLFVAAFAQCLSFVCYVKAQTPSSPFDNPAFNVNASKTEDMKVSINSFKIFLQTTIFLSGSLKTSSEKESHDNG